MQNIAEKMRKLAATIAAIAAMVAAVIKALFGGSWSELKHDVKRHAVAANEMAGFAKDGAAAVGRAVGHGLTGPLRALDLTASAVGQTLGAMLPQAPVTARTVAAGAVARDDNRAGRVDPEYQAAHDGLRDACLVGIRVQGAASSLLERGGALHAIHADGLTPPVIAWLEALNPAQLKAVVDARSYALDRHVNATKREDLVPGLPRVLSSTARLAKAVAEVDVSPAAMAEMMRKARANASVDRAGAADMATRAPRQPEGPQEGGQVIPIHGPRPRPSPKPSFG